MVNVQYIVSFEDNNLLDDIFDFREEAIDWAESHIDYRPTVEAAEVEYDDYGGVTVGDSEVIYSYKDLESEPVDESCKKSLKESEVDQVLAQFEAELNSETNESWHEAKFDFENDTEIDPPSDDVKPAKFDFDKDEDVTDFEDGVFFDANGNRVDVDNYKLHEAAEEEIPEEDPEDEVEDSEDDEPHVTKVPDTDFLVNDVEVEEENPEESKDEEDDEVDVNDIDGVVISIFDTDFDVDPVAFEKRDTAEDYLEAPVDFLKELADALGIGDQVEINAVEEDEIPEVSDDEEESKIEDKEVSSELVKDFDSDEEESEDKDEDDSEEDEEDEEFPNPEKNHLVDTYKDVDIYDCTCGKFVAMIDGKKVKKDSVDELKKCIDGECEDEEELEEAKDEKKDTKEKKSKLSEIIKKLTSLFDTDIVDRVDKFADSVNEDINYNELDNKYKSLNKEKKAKANKLLQALLSLFDMDIVDRADKFADTLDEDVDIKDLDKKYNSLSKEKKSKAKSLLQALLSLFDTDIIDRVDKFADAKNESLTEAKPTTYAGDEKVDTSYTITVDGKTTSGSGTFRDCRDAILWAIHEAKDKNNISVFWNYELDGSGDSIVTVDANVQDHGHQAITFNDWSATKEICDQLGISPVEQKRMYDKVRHLLKKSGRWNEYYEPCCAIKDETELKGMDNAVVDCQTDYKIIAHSEDEKPLDCKMKKAPLEKPLTEEDMSDEEFLEAFGKAMVERHNCKLSEDDEKKTLKK